MSFNKTEYQLTSFPCQSSIIIIIINDIYKAQALPNAAVAPKSVVACTE